MQGRMAAWNIHEAGIAKKYMYDEIGAHGFKVGMGVRYAISQINKGTLGI